MILNACLTRSFVDVVFAGRFFHFSFCLNFYIHKRSVVI